MINEVLGVLRIESSTNTGCFFFNQIFRGEWLSGHNAVKPLDFTPFPVMVIPRDASIRSPHGAHQVASINCLSKPKHLRGMRDITFHLLGSDQRTSQFYVTASAGNIPDPVSQTLAPLRPCIAADLQESNCMFVLVYITPTPGPK